MDRTKSLFHLLGALIMLGGLVWLGSSFFSSPEDEIRKRFEELSKLGQITVKEHPLERTARAKNIASFFAKTFSIEHSLSEEPTSRVFTRKEFRTKLLSLRTRLCSLELESEILNIEVSNNQAKVTAIGNALGGFCNEKGKFLERHRGIIELERLNGAWLISRITHLENLRE